MGPDNTRSGHFRWGLFRYSVISHLLVSPPEPGELQAALDSLAAQSYVHPVSGEHVHFAFSTIERWYYVARDAPNPVEALRRAVRKDLGRPRALCADAAAALERQYKSHPSWSYKLHADNLAALIEAEQPSWAPAPSVPTVRRHMRRLGLVPVRSKRRPKRSDAPRPEPRETRSYEAKHVHALWHLDFHEASRRVVDSAGRWFNPVACAVLDDRSRVCCHIQWFDEEEAATLFHALMQAFLKRGLPRALMTDRGGAMLAGETLGGLEALGVEHRPTLAYSPHQNGKQERFWGTLEGRLLKMLERVEPLTLELLNRASLAWVEQDYHRQRHDELGVSPLECMLAGPGVARAAPDSDTLRRAFTICKTRKQRRGDGTVSIESVRFELPARLRALTEPTIRYRRWDLSCAWVVDPRTDEVLARIVPLDKNSNADAQRRVIDAPASVAAPGDDDPVPPLLRKILGDFAATGLPAPYLPFPAAPGESTPTEEQP